METYRTVNDYLKLEQQISYSMEEMNNTEPMQMTEAGLKIGVGGEDEQNGNLLRAILWPYAKWDSLQQLGC